MSNWLEIIKWITETKGINIYDKDKTGKPLTFNLFNTSIQHGSFEVMKWLIDHKGFKL